MESIKTTEMPSIPAASNPFLHDAYNMGKQIGNNVMLMFGNHADEECKYLIVINERTGERLRITFDNYPSEVSPVENIINNRFLMQA